MSDVTTILRAKMLDRFSEVDSNNRLDAAELGYELGMVMSAISRPNLRRETRRPERSRTSSRRSTGVGRLRQRNW
jgi:hypothetical protein